METKRIIGIMSTLCLVLMVTGLPLLGVHAEAASGKAIELKFAHWMPPGSEFVKWAFWPFVEEINTRGRGRIHVTEYGGCALGKPFDHLDMVEKGIAEFAYITVTWSPGRFPLTDVLGLPVNYPDNKVAHEISTAVYDRILHKEFDTVYAFAAGQTPQQYLNLTKPVKTLEQLKGLRIRDPGGIQSRVVKALGAVPVMMPVPDVYLSLDKGVIDGAVMTPLMTHTYKFYEVTKFTLKFPLGCALSAMIMNKDAWEKLPADLKIIVDSAGRKFEFYKMIYQDYFMERDMGELAAVGPVYSLPPEEAKRWHAPIRAVVEKWVAEQEGKGLPAKEVVSIFREECKKKGVAFPY
jgi:TRAP-type C4-dicarboxylate transport system substrate-binding protein